MQELPQLLSTMGASRSDPKQPVWDTLAPGFFKHIFQRQRTAEFYAARSELLGYAVRHQRAINLVIDEPEVIKVAGILSGAEKDHYVLEPDVDIAAVDKLALRYGGWYLYASPGQESSPAVLKAFHTSNVCRISPTELIRLLRGLGVTFLISSFYDDHEWRVAAPLEITTHVAA